MKYFYFGSRTDCRYNPRSDFTECTGRFRSTFGGLKDVSTFYQHAMINHSYIEGAYRFVDGSMQVSLELINVIRKNGGTVLNNSEG